MREGPKPVNDSIMIRLGAGGGYQPSSLVWVPSTEMIPRIPVTEDWVVNCGR